MFSIKRLIKTCFACVMVHCAKINWNLRIKISRIEWVQFHLWDRYMCPKAGHTVLCICIPLQDKKGSVLKYRFRLVLGQCILVAFMCQWCGYLRAGGRTSSSTNITAVVFIVFFCYFSQRITISFGKNVTQLQASLPLVPSH